MYRNKSSKPKPVRGRKNRGTNSAPKLVTKDPSDDIVQMQVTADGTTRPYIPMFQKYRDRASAFTTNLKKKFPKETNSIFSDRFRNDRDEVYDHMTATYRVCHGSALLLGHRFLELKRRYGSNVEKAFYADKSLTDLFDRISTKRPVVFWKPEDEYVLRNGERSSGWTSVGTDNEGHGPKLADYLSYDEMILSALTGVSSPTHFINDGDRFNKGVVSGNADYQKQGIYMGLVGARFEKQNVMEYSLMVISKDQNKAEHGYGDFNNGKRSSPLSMAIDDNYFLEQVSYSMRASKGKKRPIFSLYESFYSKPWFPTFDEVQKHFRNQGTAQTRYRQRGDMYLDTRMWRRRIRVSLELFLFECDHRAKVAGKQAFCHLIGLGAGVWSFDKEFQNREMVEVVKSIVKEMDLGNIQVIYFGHFTGIQNGEQSVHGKKQNEIKFLFGERNPASKLQGEYKQCLLTASFAWDGASFPGNEYWEGALSASGDPAAASCSTIPYVQNPEINKEYLNGRNTRFYFVDGRSGKYEFVKLSDIQKDFDKGDGKKWLVKSAKSIPYERDRL